MLAMIVIQEQDLSSWSRRRAGSLTAAIRSRRWSVQSRPAVSTRCTASRACWRSSTRGTPAARAFEQAGCAAIGTTSAGIAYALGRPDGEALTRAELVEATGRIAAATALPLTADVESGYGATPAAVGETIAAVIEAGAVGVNLEDAAPDGSAALRDLDDQCARLRAARAAADDAGLRLFLNARTDVAWLGVGPAEQRLELIVARARAYAEAGADGIFVPGLSEPPALAALVAATPLPVNVLAARTTPSLDELARLGVKRLSVGSAPVRPRSTSPGGSRSRCWRRAARS